MISTSLKSHPYTAHNTSTTLTQNWVFDSQLGDNYGGSMGGRLQALPSCSNLREIELLRERDLGVLISKWLKGRLKL